MSSKKCSAGCGKWSFQGGLCKDHYKAPDKAGAQAASTPTRQVVAAVAKDAVEAAATKEDKETKDASLESAAPAEPLPEVPLTFGIVSDLEVSKEGTVAERATPKIEDPPDDDSEYTPPPPPAPHGFGFVPLVCTDSRVAFQVRISEVEDPLGNIKGGLEIGFSSVLPSTADLESKTETRQVTALKSRAVYVDKVGMPAGALLQPGFKKLWTPQTARRGWVVTLWLGVHGLFRLVVDGNLSEVLSSATLIPSRGQILYGFVNVFGTAKRIELVPCVLNPGTEAALTREDCELGRLLEAAAEEKKVNDARDAIERAKIRAKIDREAKVDKNCCYTIWIDDNFHYGERHTYGIYATEAEAEQDAKEIMERELRGALKQGQSAPEWQSETTGMYGGDVWIAHPKGGSVRFNCKAYAAELVARVKRREFA